MKMSGEKKKLTKGAKVAIIVTSILLIITIIVLVVFLVVLPKLAIKRMQEIHQIADNEFDEFVKKAYVTNKENIKGEVDKQTALENKRNAELDSKNKKISELEQTRTNDIDDDLNK